MDIHAVIKNDGCEDSVAPGKQVQGRNNIRNCIQYYYNYLEFA